jgi:hypothetical protein
MSDEFDDVVDPLPSAPVPARVGRVARLLARLYSSSSLVVRTRLVACLVRPLSPLGLAAVSAGAFTVVLASSRGGSLSVAMADVARFSKDQIAELVRFVEQVSPEALQQAAALFVNNRAGVGTFAASVAVLLALELGRAGAGERRARRSS